MKRRTYLLLLLIRVVSHLLLCIFRDDFPLHALLVFERVPVACVLRRNGRKGFIEFEEVMPWG